MNGDRSYTGLLVWPLNLAAMSDLRCGVQSQTQEVRHLPGVFKKTSQQDGRTKNWTMKRLLDGALRLKNSPTGEQIQNGRPTDEVTRD